MNNIVSIITPTYNSEKYIMKTIASVQNQTYQDWEMIIVDDGSADGTCKIIEKIAAGDKRIKLIRQVKNKGASAARIKSMQAATGRFIAYLDSDDIWLPRKLEKQVDFMLQRHIGFSCVSYEIIDDIGSRLYKEIHMRSKLDYRGFLTNNILQTVGIMVDTMIIDKKYLVMPDIKRRQDAATWLQILKAGYCCYGLNEVLAQYRRTKNSLSSNKLKSIKGIWILYRKIENLTLPFSCYCFVRYAFLAVWKRIYVRKIIWRGR